jgi:4-diphosphocytidyl-2C-methyl-D-erythritol kinase
VLLCGSGAAVLGLFSNLEQAEAVAALLLQEQLWAVVAEPVSHGVQVTAW